MAWVYGSSILVRQLSPIVECLCPHVCAPHALYPPYAPNALWSPPVVPMPCGPHAMCTPCHVPPTPDSTWTTRAPDYLAYHLTYPLLHSSGIVVAWLWHGCGKYCCACRIHWLPELFMLISCYTCLMLSGGFCCRGHEKMCLMPDRCVW